MEFSGFQKLDLVNYPSHVAATVFTGGCNLRCPYCHNPELAQGISKEHYSENEVLEYLERRKSMLEGLVVSGGEPTLHKDLGNFMAKVKALGLKTKLDTNALRPQVLEDLIKRGVLDFVAVDIKTTPERYAMLGCAMDANDVEKTLKRSLDILRSWSDNWEVRTTYHSLIVPEDGIEQLVRLAGKVPVWHIQAFNPAVTLDSTWGDLSAPQSAELERIACAMKAAGVNVRIR